MIAWPVLSCNGCNTSYLMGIIRIKRVCHKIPSIGERTYTTLPKTAQYADFNFISTIFSMIPWPVLSCDAFNTSHLMDIVRLNRVYLKIPSIGERTYTILLETLQSVVHSPSIACGGNPHADLTIYHLFGGNTITNTIMQYM